MEIKTPPYKSKYKDVTNVRGFKCGKSKSKYEPHQGNQEKKRRLKISKKEKIDFLERHKELSFKDFVELARETFGYSPKTIDEDIHSSFYRVRDK